VMPQTREHFDILRLLNIRQGIIVITKVDLVDADTAALVEEEVRDLTRGSFLENAPLVRVSAETGEGMAALKKAIEETALSLPERAESPLFRMPVDRSFSVAGFGTVVTGTVFSGSAVKGEKVLVLPKGLSSEIRGIEVHKNKTDKAFTGQRAALNLAGLSKDDIKPGNVICAPGYFIPTRMADCSLELLDRNSPLKPGERVKFHLGTSEVDGRLYFLEGKALVQVRLAEEVVMVKGDRFILRNQEASHTLGGGIVLDAHPNKHKRRKNLDAETLRLLPDSGLRQQVLLELGKAPALLSLTDLCARLTVKRKNAENALMGFASDNGAVIFKTSAETFALSLERFGVLAGRLQSAVQEFHASHPLLAVGLSKAEIREQCGRILAGKEMESAFPALWEALCARP
jgi:selenocysteine-specific elongation factor